MKSHIIRYLNTGGQAVITSEGVFPNSFLNTKEKFRNDQLDLLLTFSNRYYNRQFITRKPLNNQLLSRFESLLDDYFQNDKGVEYLPPVTYFAKELHLSSKYLSDMLKQLTGLTSQQHIHEKIIQMAKQYLSTTNLTVSEIAYKFGFDYPQSFSKLFKSKTNMSPLEFRQSFN